MYATKPVKESLLVGTLVLNNAIYLTVPYLAQFNSDVVKNLDLTLV